MLQSLFDREEHKRALILANGAPPSKALLLREAQRADLIVCSDGAAEYADAHGIRAHMLVGDFDSLGALRAAELAEKWKARRVEFPTKKDKSDTQLAAEAALMENCDHLTFLGALGGRFDHALMNAQLLIFCKQNGAEGVIMDDQNEIYATCTHRFVEGEVGDYLSVLPMGINTKVHSTGGLEYPMYDRDLYLGDSYSLSNKFTETRAYVELSHGWALLVRSRDREG